MTVKRKLVAIAAGVGAAPFVFALLPASTAYAHGYISSPPSRQAQCAQGTVECGSIQWEPQSVEGPKGLKSCSGGNSRFSELDDDSKNWQSTSVGNTVDFTWSLTAMHATRDWQYFIGDDKIAEFDGHGNQPPSTVTHSVDLNGYSGEEKLLAVWNIDDTANAFYACVDLNING
ncbi:chitin-binding protein [Haloactinospora alba]|uniref:Chitin-binding protein n=1 Tax=Haloactinospora alba TaxID=405555 RepID=A0A543NNM7_9ACTN|nr:lytic polysaccharide monooxygenase auxiliary activity family 9 protein [Haloactinospora alba]TQN33422.1 chitin-binding protein [Haloactinospora alba]